MTIKTTYNVKLFFKQAYKLARQPDLYFADDTDGINRFYLDTIPLKFFLLANLCRENLAHSQKRSYILKQKSGSNFISKLSPKNKPSKTKEG